MQVVTSIGEKYEVVSEVDLYAEKMARWAECELAWANVKQALKDWEEDPSEICAVQALHKASNANLKAFEAYRQASDAYRDYIYAQRWDQLNGLLADAMDRGEREAFDEHYNPQIPPCEIDVVEPDPWVEEREAAAADLQADARAREIESQS